MGHSNFPRAIAMVIPERNREIRTERDTRTERDKHGDRERERGGERERERERDVVSVLIVAAGVHLVEGNHHLCHSKGEGRKGMLLGRFISSPSALETLRPDINNHDDDEGGSDNYDDDDDYDEDERHTDRERHT